MTEIVPGTYEVRFAGPRLSDKRFRDALDMIKNTGAAYDQGTRKWTVTLTQPETQIHTCGACIDGVPVFSYDCASDGTCKRCGGTLEVTVTPEMAGADELYWLERSYDAEVTRTG